MESRVIIEEPLYYFRPNNGDEINLYRHDFDGMKVGDEFSTYGWYPDVNATEDEYITVTCVYRDENGVLLKECERTSYRNCLDEDDVKIELVWVELQKTEEQK